MEYFWPITTGITFLDVWTLPHLGFWIFVGSSLWAAKVRLLWALLTCLVVAIGWELFEHFIAFPRWPSRWQDPESWVNSWLSDPMTCIVGVWGIYLLLDRRRRRDDN